MYKEPTLLAQESLAEIRTFFEENVLPCVAPEDGEIYEVLLNRNEVGSDVSHYRRLLDEIESYDPALDGGADFEIKVIIPIIEIIGSLRNEAISGEEIRKTFIEKVRVLAETIYERAFFRNNYESFDAWKSCATYKQYQALIEKLGLLSDDALQRTRTIGAVLDALWAKPEVVAKLREEMAEEATQGGLGADSMAVGIMRGGDTEVISPDEYLHFHDLRPDLFPPTYEEYIEERNKPDHSFVLNLSL